jgi:hypothetical protein
MPFIAAASRIYVASRRGGAVALFEASGVAWTQAVAPPDAAYPKGQGGGARMPLGALQPTRTSQPRDHLRCGSDRRPLAAGPGHESKRSSPRTNRLELVPRARLTPRRAAASSSWTPMNALPTACTTPSPAFLCYPARLEMVFPTDVSSMPSSWISAATSGSVSNSRSAIRYSSAQR